MPEVAYPVELRVTYYPVRGRNIGATIEVIDHDADRLVTYAQAELDSEAKVNETLLKALMGSGTFSIDGHTIQEAHRCLTMILMNSTTWKTDQKKPYHLGD